MSIKVSARLNKDDNFIDFRLTKQEKIDKTIYLTPRRIKRTVAWRKFNNLILNADIDRQRRNLSPMLLKSNTEGSLVRVQCPNCQDGTLELLNKGELARLKENNKGDKLPKRIYGCDECKYWIDAELI